MRRILLVSSPKVTDEFDRFLRIPNLGLNSIAANITAPGYEIKVLDLVVAKNPRRFLSEYIKDYKPFLVGFSAMNFQYKSTLELAQITKSIDENIITVLGGYHSTVAYEEILNSNDNKYFDFLIKGEGEITFNSLLINLNNREELQGIPGLIYRRGDELIINEPEELINIDELKPPDRSTRVLTKGFHVFGYKADVIETSRGCVQHCNFCSIREMYGKSFRKYKTSRVIEDIQDAKKHGAKFIFITDDNITLDTKRFNQLCQAIIDNNLNSMKYIIQASVEGLNRSPELIAAMVKAGVEIVFLGIETLNEDGLSVLGKSNQFRKADAEHIIRELKKNGILVVAGFILGHPEDTLETILENYKYAKRLKPDMCAFNVLTPFPGTEIRQTLLEEDLITNKHDYERYDLYLANIKTRNLSRDQIHQLRDQFNVKYPFESRTLLPLALRYPGYFLKLIPRTLMKERQTFLNFLLQFGKSVLSFRI